MTNVVKQVSPAAATPTDLYTVPNGVSFVGSTLVIANGNAASVTYRVSIRVGGAATDPKQYLAKDVLLPPNTTDTITIGPTLNATDVVTVYASQTGVAFNLFGVES